ncbi:unnamed protein product [Vitrella brassicaformis CCMP3155]|uniref:CWH43-like N-terminal domain-containing protein n=2 Tax=Vitrella brassicaformis TaxID=1169539 RepID=A0A0G4E8V8_VITBC|nr:unnamed protein product [Vitrella brassicaformis CCMP3155]|eukprot:CEL91632.1 unnamed protein product [Vitrella brassicaformis CCMP3155]
MSAEADEPTSASEASSASYLRLPSSALHTCSLRPPACTTLVFGSAFILLFTHLICAPFAIHQGVMKFPLFHPSMAFTAPPEQYIATALLPLGGLLWLVFSLRLTRSISPYLTSCVVRSLINNQCSLLLSIAAFVSLCGVGTLPVLRYKETHDWFAIVWFGAQATQAVLYAFVLDGPMGCVVPLRSGVRKVIAVGMLVSGLAVMVGLYLCGHHDLHEWFAAIATSEWVFVALVFAFILTCVPYAQFVDTNRTSYFFLPAPPMVKDSSSSVSTGLTSRLTTVSESCGANDGMEEEQEAI